MIRISMTYLFDTVMKLEALSQLQSGSRGGLLFPIFVAEQAISELLFNSLFSSSIRSSRNAGLRLQGRLNVQLNNNDYAQIVDGFEIASIQSDYQTFKTAFLAEMGVFPSYFVSQKAGYDTDTLLDRGLAIFPANLQSKVPEAIKDAIDASRALAFELSTACGFHTFRVVESVLRCYYKALSGTDIPEDKRSLGGILHLLKKENIGDPNVVAALQQIKDLHRNPLAHPDASISLDEAISIIGMSQSVITFMLQAIPASTSDLTQLFGNPHPILPT